MSVDTQQQGDPAADEEFQQLLERAGLGRLGPEDFKRCDELLPRVSPALRQVPTRRR